MPDKFTMRTRYKRLIWLGGAVDPPPLSGAGRTLAALLLRKLQMGVPLTPTESRPRPDVGERCHELRIVDADAEWRLVHRVDPDAVLLLEVFGTTEETTPQHVIERCQWRIRRYDQQRKRKGL